MKPSREEINYGLATADAKWLIIIAAIAMLLVYLTLDMSNVDMKQVKRFCYYHCVSETDKKLEGKHVTGPRYIQVLRNCYVDCKSEEKREKDENID